VADSITRRNVLRTLAVGTVAGSVLSVIPLEAAEYAHHLIQAEKSGDAGAYTPKFFLPAQYKTLIKLCDTIIPADADSGGAVEAGAPEFIDLITSENPDFQRRLGGGIAWLDALCSDRYGAASWLDSTPEQQKEMLDLIAYRRNADKDPSLTPAVDFFTLLRSLTADGFFTSKIGIHYVGYIGNTFLREFPGCPPVPGL